MMKPRLGWIVVPVVVAASGCGDVLTTPDAAVDVDAADVPDAATRVRLTLAATGPGAIEQSSPGTSCGTGCFEYDAGATVTLTPVAAPVAVHAAWTGACVAFDAAEPCVLTLTADVTVGASFACTADWVVDQATGDDKAAGTCGAAFKTITRARGAATAGQVIRVLPGTYEAATGEAFPLSLDGVSLIGDEDSRGATTVIRASDSNGVEIAGTVTIAGFSITGANSGIMVSGTNAAATVRNNTLNGNSAGLWFSVGGTHLVTDNELADNSSHGIAHISGAPTVRYERNQILRNVIGVETNSNGADFGGGAAGSTGGNTFSCNTRNDLWMSQSEPMSATNNAWDHVPPVVGADGGGVDIYPGATTVIMTMGATQVGSPCL